jgi:hypothetical protein
MNIEFIPSSIETQNFINSPNPAKLYLPDWYKNQKSNYKKKPKFTKEGKLENTNIKMCMPFLDSLTNGYIQETWCDIYIEKNKDTESINFYYSSSPKIMGIRSVASTKYHNDEYYPYEFYWHIEWINKTPKGYSLLITHPLNRLDLPFTSMSAIIDSDIYHHAPSGNYPFLIKNNFEGLIPAGTPMYQVIPIKRESWQKKELNYDLECKKRLQKQNSKFFEFYKKNFWNKKEFN